MTAAALKRETQRLTGCVARLLPRSDDRGRIEARVPGGSRARPFAFRGLMTAAALKHLAVSLILKRQDPFRGLMTAAALKLSHVVFDLLYFPSLPRSDDRGRIEATCKSELDPDFKETFRGLMTAAALKPRSARRCWKPVTAAFRGLMTAAALKPP